MIGLRWLIEHLSAPAMPIGAEIQAEIERSSRRRRAAARLNTSVMRRVQGATSDGEQAARPLDTLDAWVKGRDTE